ncbi:MAG: glycoside hydrolase family 127 protein, partial [Candidatus Aminicenantes bacterium]|nr:glycoside hydrolase family 127 protein [Candidatus Aminicenantes bacterium]
MATRKRSVPFLLVLGAVLLAAGVVPGAQNKPKEPGLSRDYPIRPVPFTEVKVADEFWTPRLDTNRVISIPVIFLKCEQTGRIDNFAIAGGLIEGNFKGERYNDTDVYKTIEGASYSLSLHPDPALEVYLDSVIAKIAAAQEPDGYLYTPRTASLGFIQPGTGSERWAEIAVSHELYNMGHLFEAAVAHFRATGRRPLLDVALKGATLLAATFGPDKLSGFPGHQEVELGLVRLYRTTGDVRYLNLAKYFLDQRGRDWKITPYPAGSRFAIYNQPEQIQAHKPVLEQDEAVGHAVRFAYMAAAMADVAALAGNEDYAKAGQRLWENVVGKKMYLTGGIGARHDRERFGENYELPNLTAYAETCASIGNVFWNQRLFLLTGEAKYADVMERTMYNGVLAGIAIGGDKFFYANPLESDGKFKFNQDQWGRAPWFETACCPGNIARFIPSVPGYVYAVAGDALYVNLFIAGEGKMTVADRAVTVRQETRYPWEGAVRIVIEPDREARFSVHVRIPGWVGDEAVPSDLYRFVDAAPEAATLKVNGEPAKFDTVKGYARLERNWNKGDVIELTLPMPVRRVAAHEAVKDDAGKVALQRGPLVYCVEGVDNGGSALNLVIADAEPLSFEWRGDLVKGIMA